MSGEKHQEHRSPVRFGPGRGGPGRGGPAGVGLVEKPKDFKGSLRRLVAYLRPNRVRIGFVFILALLSTGFGILSPKILGMATTELFEAIKASRGIDFSYLGRILGVLGTLYLLSALFSFGQEYIMAGVSQRTVYQLRQEVKAKLSRLPLRYYDHHAHGEILSRVTNDIDTISSSLQQSLTQLVTAIVTLVGVLIMMLIISPLLTLAVVSVLPLAFLLTKVITKRSRKYFSGQQEHLGDLNGHVEEMLTGHKVIKAFNLEKQALAQFEVVNDKLYSSAWKAHYISGIIMPAMNFLNNLGFVAVSAVGGVMVAKGTMALGDLQAMIQYSRHFTQPITQTASIANILQSTMAAAERVFAVLDEEEETPDSLQGQKPNGLRGDVVFAAVRFGYKEGEDLYEKMDIDVKAGQTVAIVGPTGAGKTTLVNLLLRFYDVTDGKISVDGVDIRDYKREDLRQIFGMVLQDTWLFNGTIRENIAYGRLGASQEEIVRAATAARADHFIRTLPEGYDTVLNEEASNISQGEKQLLTIARAILADPAILILDEATSSVDTRTEILIQNAMAELMKGRTNFVIAHRLSTIRNADVILVMDKGKIVEQGNHQGLLAQRGFYSELYNSQFTKSLANNS